MARELIAGYDFERAPRPAEQPYPVDRNNPHMSAEEAARG
jgi:hypothetical protein